MRLVYPDGGRGWIGADYEVSELQINVFRLCTQKKIVEPALQSNHRVYCEFVEELTATGS